MEIKKIAGGKGAKKVSPISDEAE